MRMKLVQARIAAGLRKGEEHYGDVIAVLVHHVRRLRPWDF